MLRRGISRWGKNAGQSDDAALQEQQDADYDARDWDQEEMSAAPYAAPDQGSAEFAAAPGEDTSSHYAGDAAPGASADAAPYPADEAYPDYPNGAQQDTYTAEDEVGAEGEAYWDEEAGDEAGAEEYEEGAEERALAPMQPPQPPVRHSLIGGALMRLAGERRELEEPLEARMTEAIMVPGSNKPSRPGALGHSLFSPRAHRPRPFLTIIILALLGVMAITSVAWAAAPLNTELQFVNALNSFAGFSAPTPTTKVTFHWYVVHYGDSLQSIAKQFGVQPNGILLMNSLQDADQLTLGMRIKIPTDPNYGSDGTPQGIVNIPPPPPDKAGNVFGTNPWNSLSGPTDPNNQCAPAGNANDLAGRQAFQLINPNPHATFARGFTWFHNGVDLDNPAGTPILAAQAGMVVFAGWDNLGLGWSVKINHCNGLSTMYGHMEHPPLVKAGDYVTVGQQVGQEGSTGNSTGPHLHFMTEWWNKPANPYCFNFQLPAGNTPCTGP